MACIRKRTRTDGRVRWRAHVFLYQDPVTGKQRFRTKTFDSREEAEAWAATLKVKQKKNTLTDPCTDTLAAYGRRWLDEVAKDRVKRGTWTGYSSTFRRYIEEPPPSAPNIGSLRMDKLRPEHVRGLYAWLREEGRQRTRGAERAGTGLSATTVRSVHAVLRQLLATAFEDEAVEIDFAAKLRKYVPRKRTKNRRQVKALTREQLGRFLVAAEDDPYYPLWVLLAYTGIRPGEALALTWNDLDLKAGKVRVRGTLRRVAARHRREDEQPWYVDDPKTDGSTRTVAIPPKVVAVLTAHRAEARHVGFVFTTESGRPVDWSNLGQHWRRIMRRAGLGTFGVQSAKPTGRPGPRKQPPFTPLLPPYCLRHTHATLSLVNGVPVEVVSERLGHASTAFTMDTYADWIPERQAAAVAVWDDLLTGSGSA